MTDVAENDLNPARPPPLGRALREIRRLAGGSRKAEPNDPNGMALATVGADGMPSVRMVLLKDFDERGFVFYTNFESKKGTQILGSMKAAIVLHWKSLRRQVRVEGEVEVVTEKEADDYYHSRPRSSQTRRLGLDPVAPDAEPLRSRKARGPLHRETSHRHHPAPAALVGLPHQAELYRILGRPPVPPPRPRRSTQPAPGVAWRQGWVTEKLYP